MQNEKMLEAIIAGAAVWHRFQYDKGGNPYILHPIAVMNMLSDLVGPDKVDEELKCVAVGHDLLEDTYVTKEILTEIGMTPRIINGIVALTKVAGESYDEYLERVMLNKDAIIVKLCDLRHNSDIRRLKGVSEKDIARMEKYHKAYILLTNELNNF